jgi:hypothetical protein
MTRLRTALLVAVGVVVIQALLVPLFAAPAAKTGPRDLPVVVAGPAPAATALAAALRSERPGAFDVSTVPDARAADTALRERRAYAAFVVDTSGVSLHVASAASPTVATLLTQAAPGRTVVDVVPTATGDPRGAGFAAGLLPLVLTSVAAGVLFALLVPGRAARLTGLLGYAALAGLGASAVLHNWLGVLGGSYLTDAGAIALPALAASATVAGLGAALGRAGLGLGALLVFLVGNPLSAAGSAPELLPQPWGQVGQWLPPGAGATLVRSVAYFSGDGGFLPACVLAGWALAGLALVALAPTRAAAGTDRRAPLPPIRDTKSPHPAPI